MIVKSIPVFTASLMCTIYLSCMLSDCSGLKDFFVKNGNSGDSNGGTVGGTVYFTFEEYRPTCGWSIIITCSTEIDDVDALGMMFIANPDNYKYIYGNYPHSSDFTGYSAYTEDIKVHTFDDPSTAVVHAMWYSVCDNSTAGVCKEVSGSEGQNKLPPLDSGSIHLNEKDGQCYTGSTLELLGKVRSLVECGFVCIRLPACSGVNFRSSTHSCDLVLEDTVSNASLLGTVTGCTFWEVVWKL